MRIIDFINLNENNISVRLKRALIICSYKYNYMDDLSVLKIAKISGVGVKSTKELLNIYPNLKNEVGFISTEQVLYHLNKDARK